MFINNIFGEIPEKSVVFVIDTSGSMYDVLAAVKDHIAETLIDRAYNRPGTYFNIIEFSSEVNVNKLLLFSITYIIYKIFITMIENIVIIVINSIS